MALFIITKRIYNLKEFFFKTHSSVNLQLA